MKNSIIVFSLLFVFFLLGNHALADEYALVDIGSASGTTTYANTSLSASDVEYNTSGGSFSAGYYMIRENNLIIGGGYQQLAVSGSSGMSDPFDYTLSGTTYKAQLQLDTDQFLVSGLFGAVGYKVDVMDQLSFQPNLRIGLGNTAKATYTTTVKLSLGAVSAQAAETGQESGSATTLGIMLPLLYKSDDMAYGAQLRLGGGGLELRSGTETLTFSISSAFQLMMAFYF